MKKTLLASALACLALILVVGAVGAQGTDLQLFMSKSMGFALGNQIQGQFTLSVSGPADLASVTYQIDGRDMGTVTQAPFRYSFSTDGYSVGQHQFTATARTASGQTLKSNSIDVEIVTAASGWQSTFRLMGPILGIVLLVVLVMVGLQVLPFGANRRRYQPGEIRDYGVAGGAICDKCGRPFAINFFSPNLVTGKLQRCPYCGHWGVVRRASQEALHAAEQAEVRGAAPTVPELSQEERLRQQIEDSRISK